MIALFLGKFQPPHLGHVLTLMKLYPQYDEILIGVSDYGPQVMEYKQIERIFNAVFRHLKKYRVIPVEGSVTENTIYPFLATIDYDVIVTANKKTYNTLKKQNIETRYVRRSGGTWNSGTFLRKAMEIERKI